MKPARAIREVRIPSWERVAAGVFRLCAAAPARNIAHASSVPYEDAEPPVRIAADELQRHVKARFNVDAPVSRTSAPVGWVSPHRDPFSNTTPPQATSTPLQNISAYGEKGCNGVHVRNTGMPAPGYCLGARLIPTGRMYGPRLPPRKVFLLAQK
jgi:hypothetical protein